MDIEQKDIKVGCLGHFFVEISEKELEAEAPKVIERKMQACLEEVLYGK